MPLSRGPHPMMPPARDGDWADAFFAAGWRDGMPWVILKQSLCSPRHRARALRKTADGWAFDLFRYAVLHAPTFDVYASTADQARIVQAIRAAPTEAAVRFACIERPFLDRVGAASEMIEALARRAAAPLTAADVPGPVLIVGAAPRSRTLHLLGTPVTFDLVLETLVTHPEIVVDEAMALAILLTGHGKPAGESMPDGAPGFREHPAQSAFTRPFHPKRFTQVAAALRARAIGDGPAAKRGKLLQLLAAQLPGTIASLRAQPPRAGHTVHAVTRSRLAESVSDALQLETARTAIARVPWWTAIAGLPARERRRFFRSLALGERAVVRAALRGERLPTRPSTPRVLLSRAKAKLRTLLAAARPEGTVNTASSRGRRGGQGDPARSPTPRLRWTCR